MTKILTTIQADQGINPLGDDLIPLLLLAFGAALVFANVAAVIRPPREDPQDPNSPRVEPAPLSRTVPLALLGLLIGGWALLSLLS